MRENVCTKETYIVHVETYAQVSCPSNEKMPHDRDVNDVAPNEDEPNHQDEQQKEDDDYDDWPDDTGDFFSNNFEFYENGGESDLAFNECIGESHQEDDNLKDVMLRLKRSMHGNDDMVEEYQRQIRIVQSQMGNMTLCRGDRGKLLYQAGAIPALVSTLGKILDRLPPPKKAIAAEHEQVVILATCCWGAIRDLSCHNANVRAAVRTCHDSHENGLNLMTRYVSFYESTRWQDIASRQHLSLLTSVIGAIRNVTHSTAENCVELYENGISSLLSWRLLHSGPELPDVTQPWREAAFRAGACLINISEKCPECARECARNVTLLHILIEVWGGKATKTMKAPMLHLGLAAILNAANEELPPEVYDQSWNDILMNEEKRKQRARRFEQARKEQQSHKQGSSISDQVK